MALTAYAFGEEHARVSKTGFDHVLCKPLDLGQVAAMLKTMHPLHARQDQTPLPQGKPVHVLLRRRFLEDTPERMQEARKQLKHKELGRLQTLAHYLANSAMAVKEEDMTNQARALEAACSVLDLAGASQALARFEETVGEIMDRFSAEAEAKPEGQV